MEPSSVESSRRIWSGSKLTLTVVGSLAAVVVALPFILAIFVWRVAESTGGYDNPSAQTVAFGWGLNVAQPLILLAWSCWAAILIYRHGGSNTRRLLPLFYGVLGFIGFLALVWSAMFTSAFHRPDWWAVKSYAASWNWLAVGLTLVFAGMSALIGSLIRKLGNSVAEARSA